MSSPTSTSRMTRAQTRGRLSAKTVRKPATSAEQPSMPLKSPRSQQANIDLDEIAHRTHRSSRAPQLRNSLNSVETVRRKADATHDEAQAAPEDAVTGARDSNDPDGDELADVFVRTAPSTPEAQWQSESASGDSDAASGEMPENCEIQEGTALDNGDEGLSVRHVGRRESRLRVIYRSSNSVRSVRQGGDDGEDSESDSENGSWDWYYKQRAAHKNSKGDESDDDSGSGESIYISLAC